MEMGFQNFSQPTSLQSLNRFQDLYYSPSHLYDTTPHTLTYQQSPSQPVKVATNNNFSDRFWTGGWSGYGTSASSGYGGIGNSAAVSALGLLAFLFFLNLIQNSLINNRWLLLNFMGNQGTQQQAGAQAAGRSLNSSWDPASLVADFGPIGKKRQRRSSVSGNVTPIPVPINPIDQTSNGVFNMTLRQKSSSHLHSDVDLREGRRFKRQLGRRNITGTLLPVSCVIQFYACRFSRVFQSKKGVLLGNNTFGLARRFVRLPLRARSGNTRLLQILAPQRNQPLRTCRNLFNQCRNVRLNPRIRSRNRNGK